METITKYIQDPMVLAIATIASFVFALVSIGLAIYFYRQQNKEKRKAIFYDVTYPLNIGKGLKNIFPNFHILINDEELNDNLMYIEGRFTNINDIDIVTNEGYQKLQLILPESCLFKAVKITDATDGNFNRTINEINNFEYLITNPNNIISFTLPTVFHSTNDFKFSALYSDPNNKSKEIKFETDIPNVSLKNISEVESTSCLFILFIILIYISLTFLLAYYLGFEDIPILKALCIIYAPIVATTIIVSLCTIIGDMIQNRSKKVKIDRYTLKNSKFIITGRRLLELQRR
jgi:hypothetical protein